jgi:hypothetical protein
MIRDAAAASLFLVFSSVAASPVPAVQCRFVTGQTAALAVTGPRLNRLTLVNRAGGADISLIRLDALGKIANIETNGGIAKQQEVARIWEILHVRVGKPHAKRSCGIEWRLSPD